jgi:hypothetical protein
MSGVRILQDGSEIWKYPTLYRIDGFRYDRLSNILKIIHNEGIAKKQREVGFEAMDRQLAEANARGTKVHALCERIALEQDPWPSFVLDGQEIVLQDTELEPYYHSYKAWFGAHVKRVLFLERVLWSEELGVAGTFDQLLDLREFGVALLDIKTSRYLEWKMRLQTSFYRETALDQLLVPEIPLRGIVHLSSKKQGKECTLRKYYDHEVAFRRLTAAVELHQASMEWADDWK